MVGTVLGRRNRPHLLEAWGSRFNVQLEQHLAVFRYRDQPGMLGRVGTALGDAGVNIVSAAVGRRPDDDRDGEAVMIVTTDSRVPADVLAGARGRGRLLRRARRQPVATHREEVGVPYEQITYDVAERDRHDHAEPARGAQRLHAADGRRTGRRGRAR